MDYDKNYARLRPRLKFIPYYKNYARLWPRLKFLLYDSMIRTMQAVMTPYYWKCLTWCMILYN